MGVITNGSGGGAGGGIRYNAQTDMIQVKVNGTWVDTPYKAYGTFDGTIYNAGVQAVPLDNTGHVRASNYSSVGGATLSSGSFNFSTSGMSAATAKCVMTDTKVDLTGWNSLLVTTGLGTLNVDVSSINQMAYIIVECGCSTESTFTLYLRVSTEKDLYVQSPYLLTSLMLAQGSANVTTPINKIWLTA